ncbi:hypothetical protein N824_20650 [Pedobacter sp. V48]|nr:hypothetical protein N824_20650 [Pedobacter sp. V48]
MCKLKSHFQARKVYPFFLQIRQLLLEGTDHGANYEFYLKGSDKNVANENNLLNPDYEEWFGLIGMVTRRWPRRK